MISDAQLPMKFVNYYHLRNLMKVFMRTY